MNRTRSLPISVVLCALLLLVLPGCSEPDGDPNQAENQEVNTQDPIDPIDPIEPNERALSWEVGLEDWPAALLSVAGTSSSDLWVAGARYDSSPALLHFDGAQWESHEVNEDIDLWWVHVTASGTPFLGGTDGAVLRIENGEFQRFDTLALARHTVFGITGEEDNLYAVGGVGQRSGFVWHFDGQEWTNLALPKDIPRLAEGTTPALFKAYHDGDDTLWVVGAAGTILRRQGDGPLEALPSPTDQLLFTVHGNGNDVFAVGGTGQALIVELKDEPSKVADLDAPFLQGLFVSPDGSALAVGGFGTSLSRSTDGEWTVLELDLDLFPESLHAVWTSPEGDHFAVGGSVISPSLDQGLLLTSLEDGFSALDIPQPGPPSEPDYSCPEEVIRRGEHGTVARRWIEQNLAAIRLEIPEPGVHARNLYHLSLALFDAWALFSEDQSPLVSQALLPLLDFTAFEDQDAIEAAREEAISYAAWQILAYRYGEIHNNQRTLNCIDALLEDLGFSRPSEEEDPSFGAFVGSLVGEGIIAAFADDGALENLNYQDPDYQFLAPPLSVDEPDTDAIDPSLWQELDLAQAVTQNGIPIEAGRQGYIGPHWGNVRPFAMERPAPEELYITPGPRPELGPEMTEWVVDVLRRTAWLDIQDGVMMDISPGSYGNNPLGTDDGTGHDVNPFTGLPYEPQLVPRGDFGRVLAEYWADGPDSETPPGHWNTIAHIAVDDPLFERRFRGEGPIIENLKYDVHLYLVLNGALHDAAVVAWEIKRYYETARPITLIRWKGARGQSSDPEKPSYDPDGLPLVPGLIELITAESSAPGMPHENLRPYIGEIAVFTWPGAPGDYRNRLSPCIWIRAVEWSPYQPSTFVSPAFPGYVSGHSTFSRAAAEVLTFLTGSSYFPGGQAEFFAEQERYLDFENGPSVDVRLQWATYFDAADQAGQSRIWGGIHILPDDFDGRIFGAQVGAQASQWAQEHLFFLSPVF